MRVIIIILTVAAVLLNPTFAQDFHIQASRNAIVREQPNSASDPLLRLQRGDQLNAVTAQQTDRFYNVFLPDGHTGWVSSYVVRLHNGPATNAPDVAVVPGVGGGLTTQERAYAALHLAIGKPTGYKEIIRQGYALAYDPKLKIPVWVQYRLSKEQSEDDTHERTDDFDEDGELPPQARATLEDYSAVSSDYVRGHMAPANDMLWSENAELQSNLLTNIAPQIGNHYNGSIWKTIENRVRAWVKDRPDLTIICGPVFQARPRVRTIQRQPVTERQQLFNVIGENDVAVPTAFFKIVVDMQNPQNPDVLAFLVPHIDTVAGPERNIETYLTSVDRIEELTGLNFLTNLSTNVQDNIESVVPTSPW